MRAAQARLWVAQGNLAAAGRWAQECRLGLDDEPDYLREFEYLTLARVLVAQDKLDDATVLLARLGQAAEAAGRVRSLVGILAFQAVALQARGETVQAVVALERALSLAEPEGYIRIFVDEGPPMEKLLRRALSRGVAPDYVSRLLASIGKTAETVSPVSQRLIEPLSPRELEVLRLIADGLSNREIAEALVPAFGDEQHVDRSSYSYRARSSSPPGHDTVLYAGNTDVRLGTGVEAVETRRDNGSQGPGRRASAALQRGSLHRPGETK